MYVNPFRIMCLTLYAICTNLSYYFKKTFFFVKKIINYRNNNKDFIY